MRDKIEKLKNNPEFQAKLQEMKPKRNLWGVLLIILIFFVPEVVNVLYYQEINEWILKLTENHPFQKLAELTVWMSQKAFDGKVSLINISIGVGFLVWMFKGKEN